MLGLLGPDTRGMACNEQGCRKQRFMRRKVPHLKIMSSDYPRLGSETFSNICEVDDISEAFNEHLPTQRDIAIVYMKTFVIRLF